MTRSFWSGRRVLITGHTGFKGAWLASWLAELGAEVFGYALAPVAPSLFEQAKVATTVKSVLADIRDSERLMIAVRDARPDVVLHLAAQSLVRASYQVPIETFAVNVMGTAHLLDAVRNVPSVRAVVIVTTDKCYDNREWPWGYRENDALGGHDPYSSSKACAELVTAAYRSSFFAQHQVGIASVRAGNVIGGGDWATDRIVPDLVRSATRAEPVVVRNPKSVRPWQHVLDVLHGYLLLAEHLTEDPKTYSQAWNFGPPVEDMRTVAELADAVCAAWGVGATWRHEVGAHPHEARTLTLDATKSRTLLGWRPRLDFHQAVQWSVEWYKAQSDPRAALIAQLRRFESQP